MRLHVQDGLIASLKLAGTWIVEGKDTEKFMFVVIFLGLFIYIQPQTNIPELYCKSGQLLHPETYIINYFNIIDLVDRVVDRWLSLVDRWLTGNLLFSLHPDIKKTGTRVYAF
jgi:hypothetical protein